MGYIINREEFQLDERMVDFFFELNSKIWAGTVDFEGEIIKGFEEEMK